MPIMQRLHEQAWPATVSRGSRGLWLLAAVLDAVSWTRWTCLLADAAGAEVAKPPWPWRGTVYEALRDKRLARVTN